VQYEATVPDVVDRVVQEAVRQFSPLLSNVVLDELDRELARRGHRFVRYADGRNVYVRSERAGLRVMASLAGFIEGRLRLKINQAKSAVANPEDRHFLGFRLRFDPQSKTVEVLLSERTKRNAMERIRQLTPRTWGGTLSSRIARINAWLRGWHAFYGIASVSEQYTMRKLDAHIRRRLRAILLRHWKRRPTIVRNLIALGVKRKSAWQGVYKGRRSLWALSHIPQVDRALRTRYFTDRGLLLLAELHHHAPEIVAPAQQQLALEWG
jgi:RNA-directed DNA polymerase